MTVAISGQAPADGPATPARWKRRDRVRSPVCAAVDWMGGIPSARLARWTSLFGESAFGGQIETKKARSVVALSRVPRGKRGAPVFASGCQLIIALPQTFG